MSGRTLQADRPDIAPASDDHWEAAIRTDAALRRPVRSAERWFDLCFRLIILALASAWLFVPPAGETQRRSETTIGKATR